MEDLMKQQKSSIQEVNNMEDLKKYGYLPETLKKYGFTSIEDATNFLRNFQRG